MPYRAINFRQKLGLIAEHWQPRVVAEMNDYQFKLVKLEGDFIWHNHKDTDETFIVIEPRGVPNTGEAGGERTAQNDVWI
jgi:mannose-6-phosphate isomerase-like protein (cupin superfamily)